MKPLTVGDLLEVLQSLPKEMPAMYINVEGGCYHYVEHTGIKDVYEKEGSPIGNYWKAQFDDCKSRKTTPVKAVIFG